MINEDFYYLEVVRAVLTKNVTVEEQALHSIIGFKIIADRLDAEWPAEDPAIVIDTFGGDEAHGTEGNVVHPTLDVWCYGAVVDVSRSQQNSVALERAVAKVLNGALDRKNEFGTLMSAVRERPSTNEWDPDMERPFQRATYRTWFSTLTA